MKTLRLTPTTITERQETYRDLYPTCSDYQRFLNIISIRERISMNEARDKYGLYTYGQWKELFNQ